MQRQKTTSPTWEKLVQSKKKKEASLGGRKGREKVEGLDETDRHSRYADSELARTPRITKKVYNGRVCVSMDNELPLLLGCLLPLMSYRFCFLLCTPRRKTRLLLLLLLSALPLVVPRNAKRPPCIFILPLGLKSEFVSVCITGVGNKRCVTSLSRRIVNLVNTWRILLSVDVSSSLAVRNQFLNWSSRHSFFFFFDVNSVNTYLFSFNIWLIMIYISRWFLFFVD